MKKLFFSLLAITSLLFAASCSQEEILEVPVADGFVNATFTIGTADGIGTRAIGDGTTVDKVACAVYDADGVELAELRKYENVVNKTATYEVRLAKGQNYRVAFFAYYEAADAYELQDLKNIVVKDGQLSNVEGRDAFTAYCDVNTGETMNALEKNVTLYRPFAQLNLGIDETEFEDARKAGIIVAKSKIVVSNAYNAFNAYNDAVVTTDVAEEMVFDLNKIPTEKLLVDADNDGTAEQYTYLALNYLLVGDKGTEKSLTDVEFIWEGTEGETNNPTTTFLNIPVQRNYRTNILGKLLTNPAKFNIVIDEEFETPDYIVDENENTTHYKNVSSLDELQAAINNAANGTTFIQFLNDIQGDQVWVAQKKDVNIVIDGCSYKFNGQFKVHSNSNRNNDGKVTFKDINFETSAEGLSCIEALDFGNAKRYSQNISVENCNFAAVAGSAAEQTAVAVKVNATQNLNIKNCSATNMHSFMQAQSCDANIVVDNVTVTECKNGISFGNTASPSISNSTISSTGYGIRADGDASRGELVIKDTKITANLPIAVRKMKTSYEVALEGQNELTAGQTYEIIFTNSSEESELVAPTGTFTITGADSYNVYPAATEDQPKIANTAAKFKEFLADNTVAEILLGEDAVIEGTFAVNRQVAIKSVNDEKMATIKGRVNVSSQGTGSSFENIKFDINADSKVKNSFTGTNYKYPAIVVIYAAATSFEGCEFKTDIATGICGINYGSHAEGKVLKVNNCTFKGSFYAIRSRTLFSITNSDFDIYTDQGTLAAVWTWGNGNSGANSVTFTNNTNMNANKIYGVQLTSTTFAYDNIAINVQKNTDFLKLSEGVNSDCNFTGCTFATGSELF